MGDTFSDDPEEGVASDLWISMHPIAGADGRNVIEVGSGPSSTVQDTRRSNSEGGDPKPVEARSASEACSNIYVQKEVDVIESRRWTMT